MSHSPTAQLGHGTGSGRRTMPATRSPAARPLAGRGSSTRPSGSWPSARRVLPGGGAPKAPATISVSVPQTPTAIASTSTDPSRASGSGTSSKRTLPGLRGSTVTAFIGGPTVPFPSPGRDYRVAAMSRSNAEWSEWARRRRVSFEIQPLTELRGGEKLQVGFALSLYAEAPMDKAPGTERRAAAEKLKQELLA